MKSKVKVGDRLRYKENVGGPKGFDIRFVVCAVYEDYCLTYMAGRDRRDSRSITITDYRRNFQRDNA